MIDKLLSSGFSLSSHPLLALARLNKSTISRLLDKGLEVDPELKKILPQDLAVVEAISSNGLCSLLESEDLERNKALIDYAKALMQLESQDPIRKDKTDEPAPKGPGRLQLAYEALEKAEMGLGRRYLRGDRDAAGTTGWLMTREVELLMSCIK